jgi:hypothetical protein
MLTITAPAGMLSFQNFDKQVKNVDAANSSGLLVLSLPAAPRRNRRKDSSTKFGNRSLMEAELQTGNCPEN